MKLFSILSALSLAVTSVIAHPVQQSDAEFGFLDKRQSQTNVILAKPSGDWHTRLEIRQMKDKYPNQYTLLVLALRRWYASTSQSSYFAIAGIHGVPRVNYNNVGQCSSCGGADGYCTHDSVHFPAWHRAYVALFEQEFIKVAKQIANEYPASQRQTMVNAANLIRWPFWDWAARTASGQQVLTSLVTTGYITVNGPTGSVQILNPLYRFDFRTSQRQQMFYSPFTTYPVTYRYPTSNQANAASGTQRCADAFANTRPSLQDQIYQLFTNCKDYLHMSNDDAGSSNAGCSNSIEGIHNTIHTIIGGGGSSSVSGGHMTYLPTASFDPIFWLHHCNVDRIFAIWQGLNPTRYGASQTAPHSTWTIAQGSSQGVNSPLTPFKKNSAGDFWTTADLRNTKTDLKYTYPEFSSSDGSVSALQGYVNRLYGPNANAIAGSSKREAFPQVGELIGDVLPGNPLKASNGSLYQYVANINTPRYKLNGTYTVYLFNGKPASEDPTTWPLDKELYGPMGVLAAPNMMDHDTIAAGSVPLTRKLTEMVGTGIGSSFLDSLTELIVAPYLTKNLEWRIAQNGKSVDPSTVEGFVVSVVTSSAQPPADANSFPVYSDFIELLDVTKGQAGGANVTQASE